MRSSRSVTEAYRSRASRGNAGSNREPSSTTARSIANGGRCLSAEEAQSLVEGGAGDTAWGLAQEHMAGCAPCRRLISALARSLRPPSRVAASSSGEASAPELGPLAGDLVGRYRVLRLLGSGGMGRVFAAHDPELDRMVAIKVLGSAGLRRAGGHARLVREAQMLARLNHPNVVEVHDVGMWGEGIYVAMELVEGLTVVEWLAATRPAWTEIVAVFEQAGAGLVAAHGAGIVHRDFKPSNVIVGHDPRGAHAIGRVRVLDFGLACGLSTTIESPAPADGRHATRPAPSVTANDVVVGTPGYMSPEQCRGERPDAAADQYAFCVSLIEALYGGRPTRDGRLARPRRSAVPRRLHRALERGLADDPDRRFPGMQALLHELEAARSPRPRGLVVGVAVLVATLGVAASVGPASADAPGPTPSLAAGSSADPIARAEAIAAIDRILALRDAGEFDAAIAHANAIATDVRALGDDRLLAEFHFRRAIALMSSSRDADADLQAAFELADAAGDDALSARVALEHAANLGKREAGESAPCWRWLEHAKARARRLGHPPELMRELLQAEAQLHEAGGDVLGARRLYERTVEVARIALPPDAPELATHLDELGQALRLVGEAEAALEAHDEALAIFESAMGPDHPWTAASLLVGGHALSRLGHIDDAIDRYARALRILEAALGLENAEVSAALTNLGGHLLAVDRVEEAVAHLERARRIDEALGGSPSIPLLHNLGNAHLLRRRPDAAAEAFAAGADLVLESHGPDHPLRAVLLGGLATAFADLERTEDAERTAIESLRIRALQPVEDPMSCLTHLALGRARAQRGDERAARDALERARALAVRIPGGDPELLEEIDAALALAVD
jgi:tetratricopeptide (TPR) repeat protein